MCAVSSWQSVSGFALGDARVDEGVRGRTSPGEWCALGTRAANVLAAPASSGPICYGTKIRPLGANTPLTATLPIAPVWRLIVPRVLAGKPGAGQLAGALLALHGVTEV